MPTGRRLLLAALPLALAGAAPEPSSWRLEPVGEDAAALTGPGIRRPLLLPPRGRLVAALPLAGARVAQMRFGLSANGGRLELAALVIALDGAAVLAALEPVSWRAADGSRLTTTVAAAGDRGTLVLGREAALRRGPTLWAREAWTDYLAWSGGGLHDAPVRAPLPETRQHALAAWRRRAAALVAGAPATLSLAGLAGAGLAADPFAL